MAYPLGRHKMNDRYKNSTDNRAGSEVFSAMTFNLRFGLADDGANSWRRRKKALPALFRKYRPDFIGFQECNPFQIDYLAEILVGYEHIGKLSPAPENWQNNVIFYRHGWEPTISRHLFLSETPSVPSKFKGSRWPRQATIGMFTSNRRRLICVNTHFDFAENIQTRSAHLIMEQLAELPSEVPAILSGDFNTIPGQNCYVVFTGKDRRLSPDGPWFRNAASKPLKGTYHGFEGRTDGDHIDWILYRGCISVAGYEVVEGKFDGVYPSDHFPVIAEFKWIDDP